jgi:hypothetical protein
MGAAISLIPELENVLQHGSPRKRTEALQRITSLFLAGASAYNDEHVGLFDDVFGLLIREIEDKARAELANRRSPTRRARSSARWPMTTILQWPARSSN